MIFNLFNQYENISVDLKPFLDKYGIILSNDQPIEMPLKNIFQVVKMDDYFTNSNFYNFYNENTRSPDEIAFQEYGSYDYWWLVMLSNNFSNIFTDWLLNDAQIYDLATKMEELENKFSFNGYYNLLSELQESKRTIKLLRRSELPSLFRILARLYE